MYKHVHQPFGKPHCRQPCMANEHSASLPWQPFTVYGELPEADAWMDYCYNLWLARFPGLNKDGGWHNGDSYFHRQPPYPGGSSLFLYVASPATTTSPTPGIRVMRLYVIYQQPPFSKSGGNGSSHQNVLTRPSGSHA